MPELSCPICSEGFYRKPSQVEAAEVSYCSRECATKAQRNGKTVSCHECGEGVYRSKQYLDKHERFFCSKKCSMEWQNSELVGEKHPNWKHGKSSYRTMKEESGKQVMCVLCEEKNKQVLIVHHVDQNRENNAKENLTWLCYNCHYLVHNYPRENCRLRNKVNHGDN